MYKITAINTTGLFGKRSTCVPKVCIHDKEKTSFVHYGKFDSRQHLRAAERQGTFNSLVIKTYTLKTSLNQTSSTSTTAKETAS